MVETGPGTSVEPVARALASSASLPTRSRTSCSRTSTSITPAGSEPWPPGSREPPSGCTSAAPVTSRTPPDWWRARRACTARTGWRPSSDPWEPFRRNASGCSGTGTCSASADDPCSPSIPRGTRRTISRWWIPSTGVVFTGDALGIHVPNLPGAPTRDAAARVRSRARRREHRAHPSGRGVHAAVRALRPDRRRGSHVRPRGAPACTSGRTPSAERCGRRRISTRSWRSSRAKPPARPSPAPKPSWTSIGWRRSPASG